MNQTLILWPMIAHAALVFAVYVLLGIRRAAAVRAGHARVSGFRENREEPLESLFARNSLANQFELPVLFHISCLALMSAGAVGPASLTLAWIFILSRYVHAFIHVTTNRIRYRQPAFVIGLVSVFAMWVLLAFHLATG